MPVNNFCKGWNFQPLLFNQTRLIVTAALTVACIDIHAQIFDQQKEISSPDYQQARENIVAKFKDVNPGKFGEFLPGMLSSIATDKKVLALTLDACGPQHLEFDSELIEFLKNEKIPATLFITGLWIEKNLTAFQQLCNEPLFEIENHGLTHRPCTLGNESKYGISGTATPGVAFDEIELNARQIEFYAHRKPIFYRSATAFIDEGCLNIARELKQTVVSYELLSGDAIEGNSAEVIKTNIVKKARPGAIVIMHMNNPKANGMEALWLAIPLLRQNGYEFAKLETLLGHKKK